MKRSILCLGTTLLATSVVLFAAPAGRKKNRQAESKAEEPATPTAKAPSASTQWHTWTASGGEKLEAKFKALENGIVTAEKRDKQTVRFPIARLSIEDQKFAQACKSAQPRPLMAQDIITKAAARLDGLIDTGLKQNNTSANPPIDDARLVRRLYLDTIGRIPTELEARTFLEDRSPGKRATLINTLLNSPGYTMHMYNWLADMLRVKDDYGKGARAFLYEEWLKDQIAMNRPWDVMVSEMLTADGKLNENGAAGFLLRDAQMPLDGVSNLLSTFLGANVSCAQCHDHPFADWTQREFYNMAAFFGATDGFHEDVYRKSRKLAKTADLPNAGKKAITLILAPNAYNLVDLPTNRLKFPSDYKYKDAKPGEAVQPELIRWNRADKDNPAYQLSPVNPSQLRNQFASWMVHPDNPRFAANIANRVWKKVFGIAVQEPVSDLDDPAAASNPALLAQITTYMKQAKFDLREFQRILFNTAAYQREASETPDDLKTFRFQGPVIRRMSAEQAWDSIVTLTCGDNADQLLLRRGDDLQKTVIPDSEINLATVTKVMKDLQASGKPMRAAGGGKKGGKINPRAIVGFYEGGTPQVHSNLVLARASELPQPAPENHFLRLFGQSDRLVSDTNTTDGSVPQMLQLMNGPVQGMITSDSTALALATKRTSPTEQVTSLYLSFLCRQPSAEESAKAKAAMNTGLGIPDLAWVLLNSREFLFIP
jgi:Protein of unknown function (DUF1549)/Protein of unknown function (DUF1553)